MASRFTGRSNAESNSVEQNHTSEANRSSVSKKCPAFYGTRIFMTGFTRARNLFLSWAIPIQSMPPSHFFKINFNVILPFTPGFFKWSPLLRFAHQNRVSTFPPFHSATCPAHLSLLDFITRIISDEEYRAYSSSLCSLLHSPVTSFFLGQHILLSTLFSKILAVRS